jgi:Lanthionine synthetase C-like protein
VFGALAASLADAVPLLSRKVFVFPYDFTFTWAAGPLAKGSNICHGTGGNGYAFLNLYRRTQDDMWLERARAFAMTAIGQCHEARKEILVLDQRRGACDLP